MPLQPFRIEFTRRAIADLHRRIDATRWPAMPFDSGWDAGMSDRVLRDLVRAWRTEFDWPAVQERLNGLAHLRGPVDGEELHCVLFTGPGSEPRIPLLLIHGWPGSFVEFLEAAPLLAAGGEGVPAFDVVVPSLPGFGFSEAPRAPGMHAGAMAERLHALMGVLGYERYGVQGGDWGAIVGAALARRHPEAVRALHLNFGIGPATPDGDDATEDERAYAAFRRRFDREETGYSRLQGTKPQSLAYALNDSPVGLLAWIAEKFWAWSDHGEDLFEAIDREALLTNVTLYWLTGTALSAARVYYETARARDPSLAGPIDVPVGYARFPAEPWRPPREVVARGARLVHYSEPERGGHFAALEQPAIFVREVRSFFAAHAAG